MNLFLRKKWFTLVETIIVSVLFATIMIWIITAINRAYVFVDNTRLAVRATNLAREWVEMMYNLRDTNWRRSSWDRDKYWLNLGTWNGSELTEGNNFAWWWVYTLKELKDGHKNTYVTAESLSLGSLCTLEDFYDDGFWKDSCATARNKAELTFTWEYYYYDYENKAVKTGNAQDFLGVSWLTFYRIVRVYGIYCKNSTSSVDTTSCSEPSDPKEMRFCVKVFYKSTWKHSTELCGIMTNFME